MSFQYNDAQQEIDQKLKKDFELDEFYKPLKKNEITTINNQSRNDSTQETNQNNIIYFKTLHNSKFRPSTQQRPFAKDYMSQRK